MTTQAKPPPDDIEIIISSLHDCANELGMQEEKLRLIADKIKRLQVQQRSKAPQLPVIKP